ncbi:hypothetical protein ACS0TY_000419 [Phlomoides rotata]
MFSQCAATREKHQSTVTSIAISEDGWTLLTVGRDKVVNVWNLHDYRCRTTVPAYEALEVVKRRKDGGEQSLLKKIVQPHKLSLRKWASSADFSYSNY